MTAPRKKFSRYRLIWPVIATGIVLYVMLHSSPRHLLASAATLGEIVVEISITCFIGCILEYRSWLRFVAWLAAPLMRWGRLPPVCSAAFMSAVVSGNVAAIMLADSRRDGKITRREMILGAICNNTPSMISFSLGIMLPVIGALGVAGVIYYGITFGISIAVMVGALLAARWTADPRRTDAPPPEVPSEPCNWRTAIVKAAHRTLDLLWRVLMLTAPLYLLTAYALRQGFFKFGQNSIPPALAHWFNPETLTILASRLGGMLSSSGITAELLNQHKVSVVQVVFIFVIGNIINNPFRTLRRNLPVALGIYPGYDGAIVVMTVMTARMVLNLLVAALIFWWGR